MKKSHLYLGAVLALGVLSGCGPSWKVIKASDPTAIGGANNVAVAFDYSQMIVEKMPVEEWKASQTAKDPNYGTTWMELTKKFEDFTMQQIKASFPSAHPAAEGAGDVTLTVRPTMLGMGKYIVVSSWPSTMTARVAAHAGEGADTDEIEVRASYPASVTQPSIFQHIGHLGQTVGSQAGKFLQSKKAK